MDWMYCLEKGLISIQLDESTNETKKTYPGALSQAVEAKLVCDLSGVHGILEDHC